MTREQDIIQMIASLCANGLNQEVAYFLAVLRADVNEIKGIYVKEDTHDNTQH